MAKAITKKPTKKVSKLKTPSRVTVSGNTRNVKTTWKVPSAAKDSNSNSRADKIRIQWQFSKKDSKQKNAPTKTIEKGIGTTSSQINFANTQFGKTTYKRNSFYPVTDYKITSLSVSVALGNKKGWGKAQTATLNFKPPRAPELSEWGFDNETGIASINIKTDAGNDNLERYDTRYTLTVENTRTGETYIPDGKDSSSGSTDFDITFNAGDYQQLDYSEHIKLTLKAWSRGYAGDSDKKPSRTIYISYPAQATILDSYIDAKDSTGKCTIYIDPNSTDEHPVDRVKLEYLANVDYKDGNEIPADANWQDSGAIDDRECSALAVPVTKLMPEKGKYTWVRVKSYHLSEDVLYRYSAPHRITDLETPAPTAADDEIDIISAHPGSDGRSAVVFLGWNKDGTDDSDGTELSWSDELDTWKSTKPPEAYEFTWSDGPYYQPTQDTDIVEGKLYYTRTGEGTEENPYVYTLVENPVAADIGSYYECLYRDSAEITIKGLEEGEKYYIKARRYMEGDKTTYSKYSNVESVLTSERPEAIVATCDSYIPDGSPLTVKWTFSGNGIQKKWRIFTTSTKYILTTDSIVYLPTEDEEIVQGKTYYELNENDEFVEVQNPVASELPNYYEKGGGVNADKTYYTRTGVEGAYIYTEVANPVDSELDTYYEASTGASLADGESALGSTQISYTRLQSQAENGSVSFIVEASTGSKFVPSEVLTVSLIDSPVLDISVPTPLREQPFSFTATANRPCDLIVIVKSDGISGQMPQGIVTQVNGDTVHSNVYTPEWIEDNGLLTTEVELPTGLDFYDTGDYTISVVGVDRGTGLTSEKKKVKFTVEWANQAESPIGYVTITPIDEVDENEVHHIAAQIDLTPPANSRESDVYDIYRMDGGNAQLIGSDFPLTHTTVDEYAPFGEDMELYYRVALRTVDGDVEFAEFDYVLDYKSLRLDWAEGFLELPYGISIGDSYRKDIDIRTHLDGTRDGYWNQSIERKGSLSTSVIRIVQPEDVEKARMLARYTGPVFVRTPNGSAYEADVQVTDLSVKNKAVTAITLDCTEINITKEFQLPPPIIEEDEE